MRQDEDSPLRTAKLYLASKNIGATIRYTKSMLEWMDEGIVREFEASAGVQKKQGEQDFKPGSGPFDFKHLRLLEKKKQIGKVLNETDSLGRSVGKVILASDTSLEWGFSRDVLRKIADDSRNLVILTERMGKPSEEGSKAGLARTLWSSFEERKAGMVTESTKSGVKLEMVNTAGLAVEIQDAKREALEGSDLNVYQQYLLTQRQLQNTMQQSGASSLETSADVVDDASSDSSSSSDESETEQQGKALNISAAMGQANRKKIGLSDEDLGINVLIRKKGVYDFDVRGKKGREKMFPIVIRRKRQDEFGELIRPEEYLRAEEMNVQQGGDEEGQNGRGSQARQYDTKDTLGKKRKWDDVAASTERGLSNGGSKRQQISRGSPDIMEMAPGIEDEASDDEPEDDVSIPSKVVFSKETLTLNVRLAFVDFAGIHDQRSLQMLIPLIQPRKLILVSGMKDETLSLASDCRSLLARGRGEAGGEDVFTPLNGEKIDASVDTNAWAVKLTESLMKRLQWQKVKGLSIATITARLELTSNPSSNLLLGEGSHKKQKLLEGVAASSPSPSPSGEGVETEGELPTLDIVPSNMASATRSVAQPLQVGDLRLADLRKIMLGSGHTAEFRGEGTLLIDGSVTVRKTGTGRIEVESIAVGGGLGGTFFEVRSKIYEGLATVAGG